jgi:hypothetical protein
MAEVFEDVFSEAQRAMLEIAYDYVDGRADKLYVFAFCEDGQVYFDAFFLIHRKLVRRFQANDAIIPGEQPYETNNDRQFELMGDGIEEIEAIRRACLEHDRPMPVQMKLIYDMEREEMDAEYSYDRANLGPDDHRVGPDFCDIWFDEVEASLR